MPLVSAPPDGIEEPLPPVVPERPDLLEPVDPLGAIDEPELPLPAVPRLAPPALDPGEPVPDCAKAAPLRASAAAATAERRSDLMCRFPPVRTRRKRPRAATRPKIARPLPICRLARASP
jgi:hypothetical protein